jgi:ABC-type branched-subunit amino acid transport system substrate-binding protein
MSATLVGKLAPVAPRRIAGKGNSEGLAVNTEFNADDPAPVVKNFVAMYQKLHPNEKPEPYHATTYDAARIIRRFGFRR